MADIVFVQKEIEDKLGPMTLVAYLKSFGFDARIIIDPFKNIKAIKELKPKFIAISLCSASLEWALRACRFIKKELPGTLTVLGGPHPTYFPQVVEEPEVDIVCVGEGEKSMLRMVQQYDGTIESIKDVPNLWMIDGARIIKNPLAPLLTDEELSELPPCDRSHYADYPALRNNPHKKIWTSRGCPYQCSYCFNHAYNAMYQSLGKIVRRRRVDTVIAELKELKKYGWQCLEIVDDQFLLSSEWALEFCNKYANDIALPFSCFSTANVISRDIVDALKKAGCRVVSFGVESGVERIRREVYHKAITDAHIYRAADILRSAQMPFLTFNMVGLPDETLDDLYATVKMNQDIGTTYPWCSIICPYPGTKIADYMSLKGGIDISKKFQYSYFQGSVIKDKAEREIFLNTQKLFSFLVRTKSSRDQFIRLVKDPSLGIEKLYSLMFYWHYGRDIRRRYGISFLTLFRYWLYSKTE